MPRHRRRRDEFAGLRPRGGRRRSRRDAFSQPRHRSRRFLLVAAAIIVVVGLAASGTWLFTRTHVVPLPRMNVPGLSPRPATTAIDTLVVVTPDPSSGASRPARTGRSAQPAPALSIAVVRYLPSAGALRVLSLLPATPVATSSGAGGHRGSESIAEIAATGPGPLVSFVANALGVPVNDYVAMDAGQLGALIGALGKVQMDFPDPLRDPASGLSVPATGCQVLEPGVVASLVASVDPYYYQDGAWLADVSGPSGATKRFQALLLAVVERLETDTTSRGPNAAVVSEVVAHATVDSTLSDPELGALLGGLEHFDPEAWQGVELPAGPIRRTATHGASLTGAALATVRSFLRAFPEKRAAPSKDSAAAGGAEEAAFDPRPCTSSTQ